MDLYKAAVWHELYNLLEKKKSMEVDSKTTVEEMAKLCTRINRLVDMMDLITRQEKYSGKRQ